MEWSHIVRNRARWIRSKSASAEQDERARCFLAEIGVDDEKRKQLAKGGFVRVSIPFTSEREGWEARILPWEYIISAGTRDLRTGSIVVTRLLERPGKKSSPGFDKVLFVESAPGRLAQDWDFDEERRLVERCTRAKAFERLLSPNLLQLKTMVAKFRPNIVHLAGFDTHQGLELIGDTRHADVGDGYLLAGPSGIEPVTAGALAGALNPDGFSPSLVFCNIWNSAARIAPLIVAAGGHSAIGIQDGIDDALAEIFLGNFYTGIAQSKDLRNSFDIGWNSLQSQSKPLRGTGITLWESESDAKATGRSAPKKLPKESPTPSAIVASSVQADQIPRLIAVTVEPEPQFSYGLLHNNRDIFRRFLIRNLANAPITGVEVFVELHSNEGTYPWRQSFTINGPVLDLSRAVRIALTSNLARTLDEVLRTCLYTRVTWGHHEVFSQTFPVTLAPVDQWADTDADRSFLPSFVFPRDCAVSRVLRSAERYVTALRDDPSAGFDGYQAFDRDLTVPTANIDHQVQAIWYSIVYEVPASYINPPPTYAIASQRIRTPSEIVGGGYGTCIDLALFLASCLEAIEIYPVIFILNDHAFPGYWRTDSARTNFLRRATQAATNPNDVTDGIGGDSSAAGTRIEAPWSFDASILKEIRRAIDSNHLIPLESVGLTGRWSLAEAILQGHEYFSEANSERFVAMLDVLAAREHGVTPLPLGPRLG